MCNRMSFHAPTARRACESKIARQTESRINCPDCGSSISLTSDARGAIVAQTASVTIEETLTGPFEQIAASRQSVSQAPLSVLIVWTSVALAAASHCDRGPPQDSGEATPKPTSAKGDRPALLSPSESPSATKDHINEPTVAAAAVPAPVEPQSHIEAPLAHAAEQAPVAPANPANALPIPGSPGARWPRVDVAAQLNQPIREFVQTNPVAVRSLFRQVAELSRGRSRRVRCGGRTVERTARPDHHAGSERNKRRSDSDAVAPPAHLRTEFRDGTIRILPPE